MYDRGCANNFVQVLCTKKEPSKFNFRAFVDETSSSSAKPSGGRGSIQIQRTSVGNYNSDECRREKVEDDLEMDDVLKMSRSRNSGGNGDIRSRISERLSSSPRFSEVDLPLEFESQVHTKHDYNFNKRNERR